METIGKGPSAQICSFTDSLKGTITVHQGFFLRVHVLKYFYFGPQVPFQGLLSDYSKASVYTTTLLHGSLG